MALLTQHRVASEDYKKKHDIGASSQFEYKDWEQRSWIWGNVHHDGKPNPSLLLADKEQFHQFLVATLPCRSFGAMTAVTLAFETSLMRTHPGSLLSSLSSHRHVFGSYWWSPGHKLPQTLINLLNLCCQQCSCF